MAITMTEEERAFCTELEHLICQNNLYNFLVTTNNSETVKNMTNNKTNQLKTLIRLYKLVYKNLELVCQPREAWLRLAVTIYNKLSEFQREHIIRRYDDVDPKFMKRYNNIYMKLRDHLLMHLKNRDSSRFNKEIEPYKSLYENIVYEMHISRTVSV